MFESIGNSSFCSRNVLRVSIWSLALTLAGSIAAQADIWQNGDVITYTQSDWGSAESTLLTDNYNKVYASAGDVFFLGEATPAFSAEFTSAQPLRSFLPQNGSIEAFDANLLNPTTTSAGGFGGEIAALKLNVDYSAAGLTLGTSKIAFGNLFLENTGFTAINGLSVSQLLGDANRLISGQSVGALTFADVDTELVLINASFEGGIVDNIATDELFSSPVSGGSGGTGTISPAPEIDPNGLVVELTMLLGGLAVLRGQRRQFLTLNSITT